MNQPWKIDQAPDKGNVTLEDIAQLPLETLTPLGFIFIWVEKENLSLVCDVMQEKNFNYVENLAWVQMQRTTPLLGRSLDTWRAPTERCSSSDDQ